MIILLCENSGAIFLVLVDLTAGRLAGWQAGQQSDQILVDSKFFTNRTVRIFMEFNEGTLLS